MENKIVPTGHILRQALEMGLWRILAMAFGTLGYIWAARCLGPENLGISTMVQATLAQITLVVGLNQEPLLVRAFKEARSVKERNAIISEVISFRLCAAIVIIVVAIPCMLAQDLPQRWKLALATAFGLLLIQANPPTWVLQGQENMPASYRAMALPPVISSVCYFVFFRPGMPAGSDLLVGLFAGIVGCAMGWFPALQGKHSVRLGLTQLLSALPRLWQGRWLAITGLMLYIYVSFDAPLIGYLHSIEELGKYRTALTVVTAVQPFIAIVSQLLYPRFIEWNKLGGQILWMRQLQLARTGCLVGIPMVMLAFLLLPVLYGPIFGATFQSAALPCAILLTSKVVVVINGIFGWGLWAKHKDMEMLFLMTVVAMLSVSLNIILIPRMGMLAAAYINLGSEILILIGCFILGRYYNSHN